MGIRKTYIGKVLYRVGLIVDTKTEDSFEYQTDAWKRDAECGCGINCCERELILTDKATVGEFIGFVALYIEEGVLKFRLPDGTVKTVTST